MNVYVREKRRQKTIAKMYATQEKERERRTQLRKNK